VRTQTSGEGRLAAIYPRHSGLDCFASSPGAQLRTRNDGLVAGGAAGAKTSVQLATNTRHSRLCATRANGGISPEITRVFRAICRENPGCTSIA